MEIPPRFIIHETEHWILNHHMSSALPGYLMLGAKARTNSLSSLPAVAQAELGMLLARTQQICEEQLQPKRLYIGRYGHEPGHSIHFHFIPVYPWVEELFWTDERYRQLQSFSSKANALSETDGAELTLFIWREFGERPEPPQIQGRTISEIIKALRLAHRPTD